MKDTTTSLNWPNWPETKKSPIVIYPLDNWAKLCSWFRLQLIKIRSKAQVENVFFLGKMVIKNNGILKIGASTIFQSNFQVSRLAIDKEATLSIGENCFMNSVIIAASEYIEIGNNCQFAPFVHLMDSDFHDLYDRSLKGKSSPILIGNNVQVGAKVTILKGVKIGDNAVILPGAVVTKDVPAGAKVAGIPAKILVD